MAREFYPRLTTVVSFKESYLLLFSSFLIHALVLEGRVKFFIPFWKEIIREMGEQGPEWLAKVCDRLQPFYGAPLVSTSDRPQARKEGKLAAKLALRPISARLLMPQL